MSQFLGRIRSLTGMVALAPRARRGRQAGVGKSRQAGQGCIGRRPLRAARTGSRPDRSRDLGRARRASPAPGRYRVRRRRRRSASLLARFDPTIMGSRVPIDSGAGSRSGSGKGVGSARTGRIGPGVVGVAGTSPRLTWDAVGDLPVGAGFGRPDGWDRDSIGRARLSGSRLCSRMARLSR